MKPCHKISQAAKALTLQGILKSEQIRQENFHEVISKKIWSNLPTANHITTVAESILSQMMKKISSYSYRRISVNEFEVEYIRSTEQLKKLLSQCHPIPIFKESEE